MEGLSMASMPFSPGITLPSLRIAIGSRQGAAPRYQQLSIKGGGGMEDVTCPFLPGQIPGR